MKLRYFIPSLVAAGFLPAERAVAVIVPPTDGVKKLSLFDVFKSRHKYTLAGHSSHSSHASHGSHSSHRSSTGGGYYFAPVSPPAPASPQPLYSAPVPAPLVTLPGNSNKFRQIVIQVQTALKLFGYQMPVTGVVDDATRQALISFQNDWSMKPTGTITPAVLEALGISAQ
jgi:hypothetical protein